MSQDLLSSAAWQRIHQFSADKPTPCLIFDLPTLREKYAELERAFGMTESSSVVPTSSQAGRSRRHRPRARQSTLPPSSSLSPSPSFPENLGGYAQ